MSGRVVIPAADELEVAEVVRPTSPPGEGFLPFAGNGNGNVPAMAAAGGGYRIHSTGLTHDERGYPDITTTAQRKLMDRLIGKIRDNVDEIAELESRLLTGARLLVVSYGSTSRAAWQAVRSAREEGLPVGWLRLVTAWPFPERQMAALAADLDHILVPEVNYGQMVHPVREAVDCGVSSLVHAGGDLHTPNEILAGIRAMADGDSAEGGR
jgi:2-oxoglutarate ferredoxin oxidoreductase subunit alpha